MLVGGAAALVLAAPMSLAVAGSATPAFASGGGITCGHLKGTWDGISSTEGAATIGKCSPMDKQNKTGSTTFAELLTGGTITWSKSGDTTDFSSSFVGSIGPDCSTKNGTVEFIITGTVTGGTSTYTQAGDPVSASFCVNGKTGKVKLVKGTTLSL
jgi:hypothetical protein